MYVMILAIVLGTAAWAVAVWRFGAPVVVVLVALIVIGLGWMTREPKA